MTDIPQLLAQHPQAKLMSGPTSVDRLGRLSDFLGIDLWLKRDDLTSLSFGGNKTRQLEFYLGDALKQQASALMITGAVQSNFVRSAAAAAAKFGLKAIIQLEDRVPGMSSLYHHSGNVLLEGLLDVETLYYPDGEDESGADNALAERAKILRENGEVPYIIPLGINHPPLGALGYVSAADELLDQLDDIDAIVCPSGSGATHGGLLSGLKIKGYQGRVYGVCVRREAHLQSQRIHQLINRLSLLLEIDLPVSQHDILLEDGALKPGYGKLDQQTIDAIKLMAQQEGIFLDPVYTSKTFAGLLLLLKSGAIKPGQRVMMIHTGGQAALFSYQNELL